MSRHEQLELQNDPFLSPMIEGVIDDWINKYPVTGGALGIDNINDSAQIRMWVRGVWGRIKDQILNAGLPYDNNVILLIAKKYFHTCLSTHPFYEKMKPYLPV